MTAVLGRTAPPALDADWMHDAACRTDDVDPDMFFLDRYTHDRVDPDIAVCRNGCRLCTALRVCRNCPVAAACWTHIMRVEDTAKSNRAGVWAGTTPSQRDAIYRRQRREAINA